MRPLAANIVQVPFTHDVSVGQTLPRAPQLLLSAAKDKQAPSIIVKPVGHVEVHVAA
jgi:hypothetical protein